MSYQKSEKDREGHELSERIRLLDEELPDLLRFAVSDTDLKKSVIRRFGPGIGNIVVWLNRRHRRAFVELDDGQTLTADIKRTHIRLEGEASITTNLSDHRQVRIVGQILQQASIRHIGGADKQLCIDRAVSEIREKLGSDLRGPPSIWIRTHLLRYFDSHYAVFRGETSLGWLVVDYWPGMYSPQFHRRRKD